MQELFLFILFPLMEQPGVKWRPVCSAFKNIAGMTHEQARTLVFLYCGGGFDRKLRLLE